ncbi:MAG TPA: DNA photolyase, partial [Spirochaeta sp.]|nr:DNA photolyase [Spirochaeta sp.]
MSDSRVSNKIAFLLKEDVDFIEKMAAEYRLSFQDCRQLEIIASDLRRWDEGTLKTIWYDPENPRVQGKDRRKKAMDAVKDCWENLKSDPKDYSGFKPDYKAAPVDSRLSEQPAGNPILGRCPVASEKTRCCNLQTLDAVINCGFDCSYCSI